MKKMVDPTMRDKILEYLKDAAEKDPILNEKFDPSKIDECCDKIVGKVMEKYVKQNGRRDGGCFCPPDEVFKMARDFFIDGNPAAETPQDGDGNERDEEPPEANEEPAVTPEKPKKKKLGELEQLDLFGGAI